MQERLTGFLVDRSGSVATTVAMVMAMLLAMGALVIDYGHMAWVQNELKTAAEAGALAGAKALAPYTGTPLTPNWSQAQTLATQTVMQNRADNQFLSDCQAQPGYWSLSQKILQSTGIVPTATDVPAIQVAIAKSAGHNGGPLRTMFAPIFGIQSFDLGAQAVAMISFPQGMPGGALFPLAASPTIVNQYWTQEPPVSFRIGDESANGKWTSFKSTSSNADYVSGLIANGNPDPLNLNDTIYMLPGVTASNYGDASSRIGKTVMIALADISNSSTPVLGFVAFTIEAVSQGSKYIQGHFDKNFNITAATLVGSPADPSDPNQSNPNPPKLVN